jgi:hypothetical protein
VKVFDGVRFGPSAAPDAASPSAAPHQTTYR